MISPLVVAPGIVVLALLSSAYAAGSSRRLKAVLQRSDWIAIAMLGILAAIVHASDSHPLFYGNEYEDSYEYVASARLLGTMPWSLYYNPACLLGSVEVCVLSA